MCPCDFENLFYIITDHCLRGNRSWDSFSVAHRLLFDQLYGSIASVLFFSVINNTMIIISLSQVFAQFALQLFTTLCSYAWYSIWKNKFTLSLKYWNLHCSSLQTCTLLLSKDWTYIFGIWQHGNMATCITSIHPSCMKKTQVPQV